VACPICYCKECLFRTDVFDHQPERYLGWAQRKGAARLPGDATSFHLTRLMHVSISCVGCGLCTSACPAGLPVDAIFQSVARRTQALFNYVPGRDPAEPLPLAAFKQDEFSALGTSEH
jgi:formate dehydrogenase (coenzyme F420) beta subunit